MSLVGDAIKPIREHFILTEQQFLERFKVCETCEHLKGQHDRCELCGCFMRFKAQLKHAHCPLGKW